MNLYLVSRTDKVCYDEYDSFVVAALTKEFAREQWPGPCQWFRDGVGKPHLDKLHSYWPQSKEKLKVELIGKTEKDLHQGEIVCASYNAG